MLVMPHRFKKIGVYNLVVRRIFSDILLVLGLKNVEKQCVRPLCNPSVISCGKRGGIRRELSGMDGLRYNGILESECDPWLRFRTRHHPNERKLVVSIENHFFTTAITIISFYFGIMVMNMGTRCKVAPM
jgi:hypothetical protein